VAQARERGTHKKTKKVSVNKVNKSVGDEATGVK
jgi:hypothetical protein